MKNKKTPKLSVFFEVAITISSVWRVSHRIYQIFIFAWTTSLPTPRYLDGWKHLYFDILVGELNQHPTPTWSV